MRVEGPQPPFQTQASEISLSQPQSFPSKLPATALKEWHREFRPFVERMTHARVADYHAAEDVIQEIWIKVGKSIDRYEPSRASRITFINHIIMSCIVDFHRKQQVRARISQPNMAQHWDCGQTEEQRAPVSEHRQSQHNLENRDYLRFYLAKLPEKNRLVMEAFYFQQVPIKRIAAQLGISVQSAHSLLSSGRKTLHLLITGTPRPILDRNGRKAPTSSQSQQQDSN